MIDQKTVFHIAKLARLQISENEAKVYSEQLTKALGFFEQISRVSTDGVEPLVTPTDIHSFWREDSSKNEYTPEEIVANAPDKLGNLFKVPPVV